MNSVIEPQLINFLREELLIPMDAIELATGHRDHSQQLPMILWQYGLVTLSQLDRIFDWLAAA